MPAWFSCTGLSPSLAGLSRTVPLTLQVTYAVRTPERTRSGLGSSAFARRYLRNRLVSFSSSGYLDVSVHRVPSVNLWIQLTVHTLRMWVPPFRDLRIFVYVPLPAAFRSLSRLSSALSAKASALCSWCFFSVMTLFQATTFLD